jgi:hypothetical protein
MNHPRKTVSLIAFVALLSAGPALTQAPSTEATPEAKAAAPVAYVYVQTLKGINLYDAAADGKLTLVKGSPFQTSGEVIGSNGKYFITLGTDDVHSYAVESNGAIGKQVSEINTQDYDGASCGESYGTTDANIDHAGQTVYVELASYTACTTIQSYNIAKESGGLSFIGTAAFESNGIDILSNPPSITANDKFAYTGALYGCGGCANTWSGFVRNGSGTLENLNFKVTYPQSLNSSPYPFLPGLVAADLTDHLAAVVTTEGPEYPEVGPPQLASYTVDSQGNLSTTNPAKSIPYTKVRPTIMKMSPSGKLLAVGGGYPGGGGLEVYHFNGAEPITPHGSLLTTDPITDVGWDDNNHLFVLSDSANEVLVYTITTGSTVEAPGSPYNIESSNACNLHYGGFCRSGLVVVPK